jgi:soluble lytic murein transglycosylase-like protein
MTDQLQPLKPFTFLSAEIAQLIKIEAARQGLSEVLVTAIVYQESLGLPNAIRFEPKAHDFWKPEIYAAKLKISLQTELNCQKSSVGLMQIMFSTARFLGYEGSFAGLFDPKINLVWGCTYLKQLCKEYVNVSDQAAAYNAGSVKRKDDGSYKNQEYVDSVLGYIKLLTGQVSLQ